MSITRVSRRLVSRQFGPLTGILRIITLFSILQIVSFLMLSVSVSGVQQNGGRNQSVLLQQVGVDEAQVALLSANDLLSRAGVYPMQNAATGSNGSWHPLVEEVYRVLAQPKIAWDAWWGMRPWSDPDPAGDYQHFYSGIKEQVDRLIRSGSISTFFAVSMQAFQTDFNGNCMHFQQGSGRYTEVGRRQLLTSLECLRSLLLFIPLVLIAITLLVWRSMFHWMIMPLRRLIDHIDILAMGDFFRPTPQVGRFNWETTQLSSRTVTMQQELCALVQQVNDATIVMVENINELTQNNKQLYQQSARQSEELNTVILHISILGAYVKDDSGLTELTDQCVTQAHDTMADGDQMAVMVDASMQVIVTRSSEIWGTITLIDNITFQTNILALNAAIGATYVGEQGHGFAIVVKGVGLLTRKSGQFTQNTQTLIEHSLRGIEEGFHAVNGPDKNLQQAIALVENLGVLLSDISIVTLDQRSSIHQLTHRLHTPNDGAR